MMRRGDRPRRWGLAVLTILACLGAAFAPARGQEETGTSIQNLLGQQPDQTENGKPQLAIQARLLAETLQPGAEATLAVTVKLPPEFYIYSMNRDFGGATRIEIRESPGLEPIDEEFRPDRAPKTTFEPVLDQNVEKFFDQVTWRRKYRIAPDADPADVSITGTLAGQYCKAGQGGRCIPIRPPREFTASLSQGKVASGAAKQPAAETPTFEYELTPKRAGDKADPLRLRFALKPRDAGPGEEVTLVITAELEDDWHAFALSHDPDMAGKPTRIELNAVNGLSPLSGEFQPSEEYEVEKPLDNIVQRVHYGQISWSRRFRVTEESDGEFGVSGEVAYQICRAGACRPLKTVPFQLGHVSGESAAAESAEEKEAETPLAASPSGAGVAEGSAGSLPWYLFAAFLGGLILNIMPCVLPVIAIKVMGFVQQSGESRGRIFLLNVAYAGGVIAVFLFLASLVAGLGYGWGELFQSEGFLLAMACIIFAMALCLLGVYEIPVPGFVGAAAGTQQREGLSGAFLTGILATLLATPCSGPFLGATLAWSARQPALVTYLIFTVMGLGMAFPYVVFGLFPGAIKWLPKPGNWMVRFKELAGFVLMATVIFFFYVLDEALTVPLLVMLLGISLGLWMIGNFSGLNRPVRYRIVMRTTAVALAVLIGAFGYSLADSGERGKTELPWEPFSTARLQQALENDRTVLIDFTADWCLTCKTNEKLALNTRETLELVKRHNIVALYADYTNESQEIKRWLEKFDSISVPLTVIYPGGRPEQPIVMRDLYTQSALLDNLKKASALAEKPEQPSSRQTALK